MFKYDVPHLLKSFYCHSGSPRSLGSLAMTCSGVIASYGLEQMQGTYSKKPDSPFQLYGNRPIASGGSPLVGFVAVGFDFVFIVEEDDESFRFEFAYDFPFVDLVSPHGVSIFIAFFERHTKPVDDFQLRGDIVLDIFDFSTIKIFSHGGATQP
jgi:hypothetical protein